MFIWLFILCHALFYCWEYNNNNDTTNSAFLARNLWAPRYQGSEWHESTEQLTSDLSWWAAWRFCFKFKETVPPSFPTLSLIGASGSVCMYVWMFVWMYVCMCILCVHIYVCACAYYVGMCRCVWVCVFMVWVYVMCVEVYVCVLRVCVLCVWVYVLYVSVCGSGGRMCCACEGERAPCPFGHQRSGMGPSSSSPVGLRSTSSKDRPNLSLRPLTHSTVYISA